MDEEIQQQIMEFEQGRVQLANISAQKQQLKIQVATLKQTLEELGKTKEKSVFRAVGNILINTDVKEAKKEVEEKHESFELRLKSVEKQEESLTNKLNKIKAELEKAQSQAAEHDTVKETESGSRNESA